MPQFLPLFETAYEARIAKGLKPTGMYVSSALWHELTDASQIILVKAQISFTTTILPDGVSLPPLPVDEMLPTYRGTIVHVGPLLEDHQFEFSPG